MKNKYVLFVTLDINGVVYSKDNFYGNQKVIQFNETLENFKSITQNKKIIIDASVYENQKEFILEDREYLTIKKVNEYVEECSNFSFFENFNDVIDFIENNYDDETFYVLVGSSLITKVFPYADELIITWIHKLYRDGIHYLPIDKIFSDYECFNNVDWKRDESGLLYKIERFLK